ncbi:MAG: hypothetical protein ACXAB7_12295 [Candidatus Kariarchaeaceae archaeon]
MDHHIHDTYLSSGWASTTWSWLMTTIGHSGWTLVNVIGSIWSGVSTAVTTINDGFQTAWSGIKSGIQFIANAVIQSILNGFRTITVKLIQGIFEIFKIFDENLLITNIQDGVRFLGSDIKVTSSNLKFIIEIDSYQLNLGNILLNNVPETLGLIPDIDDDYSQHLGNVDKNAIIISLTQLLATLLILNTYEKAAVNPYAMIGLVASFLVSLIAQVFIGFGIIDNIYDVTEDDNLRLSMMNYYRTAGILTVLLTIFGKWSGTKIPTGKTGSGMTYAQAFIKGKGYIKGGVQAFAIANTILLLFGVYSFVEFADAVEDSNGLAATAMGMNILSVIATYWWDVPLVILIYNALLTIIYWAFAAYLNWRSI